MPRGPENQPNPLSVAAPRLQDPDACHTGPDWARPPAKLARKSRSSRYATAHEIDRLAVEAASNHNLPHRPVTLASGRADGRQWFRRLGYRTQGDYAREELGTSARSLRRMACLGRRLETLPEARAAFESGTLPMIKAEVIARIATHQTEQRWLAMAKELTVRDLSRTVGTHLKWQREVAAATAGDSPPTYDLPASGCHDTDPPTPETDDEPRAVWRTEVPGWMIGKTHTVLRLVNKVAGASFPEGTRWEFVAAEFLSGMPASPPSPPSPTIPRSFKIPSPITTNEGQRRVMTNDGPVLRNLEPATAPDAMSSAPAPTPASGATPRGEAPTPAPDLPPPRLTPWELHAALKDSSVSGAAASHELGRLLRQIRHRHLWYAVGYPSFDRYVRERLDISPRTARRLIRSEAAGRRHPLLKKACVEGRLTPLKASVLARALDLGLKQGMTHRWIEYARRMSLLRLTDAVDWACARAAADPQWARLDGAPPHPSFRFGGALIGRTMAGDGDDATELRPMLATSETCTLRMWLTSGERRALERAIKGVRAARGPDWPLWACINDLLDHFAGTYEDPAYRALSRHTPVLVRDDWQCQAPGCTARAGLHVHHITARGVGGPNTFDNLIVVCGFHHMLIHRGWVRCRGKAPRMVRWSFGVRGHDLFIHRNRFHTVDAPEPRRTAIARYVGHYRLDPEEWWSDVEVRLQGRQTGSISTAA